MNTDGAGAAATKKHKKTQKGKLGSRGGRRPTLSRADALRSVSVHHEGHEEHEGGRGQDHIRSFTPGVGPGLRWGRPSGAEKTEAGAIRKPWKGGVTWTKRGGLREVPLSSRDLWTDAVWCGAWGGLRRGNKGLLGLDGHNLERSYLLVSRPRSVASSHQSATHSAPFG
mgnify:CR=1 FL=1